MQIRNATFVARMIIAKAVPVQLFPFFQGNTRGTVLVLYIDFRVEPGNPCMSKRNEEAVSA